MCTQIIWVAAADDVSLGGTPWGGTKGCVARNCSRKITWGFRVFSLLDTIETTVGKKIGLNAVTPRVQAFIRGGTLGIKNEVSLMCSHSGEILVDFSTTGKERPWKTHKTNGQLLSEVFERLGKENKAERVCNCGSTLKFNVCPQGHEKRLSWANFCRVRLCPMCAWRRSLMLAHQLKQVAHEANKQQPLRWIFLTLTVRNCDSEDLDETVDLMMKSWHKMVRRKQFMNVAVGYFRAFEVTRNLFEDTYHPHFHVLLAVEPNYFRSKDKYMKTEQWVKLWRESLKIDYDPICDVRIVKNKRNQEKEMKILADKGIELASSAVAELAKYSTKSEDYLIYNEYKQVQKGSKVKLVPITDSGLNEKRTDDAVLTLDAALSRRRLIAFGGLMKDVWNELQLEDIEDDSVDLVHADEDSKCRCSACGSDMLEEMYSWIPGLNNYMKKE